MNLPQSPSNADAGSTPTTGPGVLADAVPGPSGADELEQLLQRFLASMVALAGARAGAVRVMTDDGAHLRLVGQIGMSGAVLATERLVDRHCGVCGVAADSDVLQWADDLQPCLRHNRGNTFGPHTTRVLAMSLRHGKQVLGVYNLYFDSAVEIGPETAAVLRLIGELLGLALHNASIERERLRVTVLHERQALVHEVHDAIAQDLVYVKMRLPLLSDAMLAHDDQRSVKYLSDVKQSVTRVHDNLREVMTYFRTRMDPLGLLHAIGDLADGFHDRTGIRLTVGNSAGVLHLSDEQEAQVFHIVQEALANIAKHSSAKNARLVISRRGGCIEFVVEDDGAGMSRWAAPKANSPEARSAEGTPVTATTTRHDARTGDGPAHFGMEIMKGRADRLGGTIEVGQNDGGGTRVRLSVPVGAPAAVLPAHAGAGNG